MNMTKLTALENSDNIWETSRRAPSRRAQLPAPQTAANDALQSSGERSLEMCVLLSKNTISLSSLSDNRTDVPRPVTHCVLEEMLLLVSGCKEALTKS